MGVAKTKNIKYVSCVPLLYHTSWNKNNMWQKCESLGFSPIINSSNPGVKEKRKQFWVFLLNIAANPAHFGWKTSLRNTQSCNKGLLVVRSFCFWAVWAARLKKVWGRLWAIFDGSFFMFWGSNVNVLHKGLLLQEWVFRLGVEEKS